MLLGGSLTILLTQFVLVVERAHLVTLLPLVVLADFYLLSVEKRSLDGILEEISVLVVHFFVEILSSWGGDLLLILENLHEVRFDIGCTHFH